MTRFITQRPVCRVDKARAKQDERRGSRTSCCSAGGAINPSDSRGSALAAVLGRRRSTTQRDVSTQHDGTTGTSSGETGENSGFGGTA